MDSIKIAFVTALFTAASVCWGGEKNDTSPVSNDGSNVSRSFADSDVPEPPREFRAAWVATVANIDWPSKPGLPVEVQKREAIAILDRLVELNLNAVIFQVRPQADAFYHSNLEPWSYYLTGRQGRAPEPYYDPLAFWIDEAHSRGLQIHAWFNPYRANHPSCRGPLSSNSLVEAKPELVVRLGDKGYWWMDPSLEAARKHSIDVILDVVERYDIDGVHFDDYFYPYPSYNDNEDFPDQASYEAYKKSGGQLARDDWRRAAVNKLIAELHHRIKQKKPHVEFGISPFGIWRPGYPAGIRGLDQYNVLYADAKLWLNEGWVDYFNPQLYWPIASEGQSFPVLLRWWSQQNTQRRHLWPGTIIRKNDKANAAEIVNQVELVRGVLGQDPGICIFSMKHLMRKDSAVAAALGKGPWLQPALIPASSWLTKEVPQRPRLTLVDEGGTVPKRTVRIEPCDSSVFLFVVHERKGESWNTAAILPAATREYSPEEDVNAVAIRCVDRLRNLGAPEMIVID